MTTVEERMQILKMIEEGKISADEGASLLSALGSKKSASRAVSGGTRARWFRVRVTDMVTGRNKVNVNIPMGLVDVGLKMGARFVPNTDDSDFEDLVEQIRSGAQGKVLDVTNEEDGERVEIFIE
jgi:hypothetical protein